MRFISLLGRFHEDFLRERTPCTGVLYALSICKSTKEPVASPPSLDSYRTKSLKQSSHSNLDYFVMISDLVNIWPTGIMVTSNFCLAYQPSLRRWCLGCNIWIWARSMSTECSWTEWPNLGESISSVSWC